MMRVLGIILICAAAGGSGMLYAASLNREYEKLLGFIRLIRFIGTRIECFSQPLMTVYADFSDPALDSCGFTGALREDGFTTALCRCRDELCLDDAVFGILSEFGDGLGKSFSDDQVKHCARYADMLSKRASELEKTLPGRKKTAVAVSASLAVMAAVILL